MESLFDPKDLRIVEDVRSGRNLACVRSFKAGELLLRSAPMGVGVSHRFAHQWCSYCMSFNDTGKYTLCCESCKHAHYCSEDCRAAHAEAHASQCGALMLMMKAGLRHEEEVLAIWLADAWSSREPKPAATPAAASLEALRRKWALTCKPCSLLHEAAPSGRCHGACDFAERAAAAKRPAAKGADIEEPPIPGLDHLLGLCKDGPGFEGYTERAKSYKSAAKCFADSFEKALRAGHVARAARDLAKQQGHGDVEATDAALKRERPEQEVLEDMLTRGQRNDFGLFDPTGAEHGKVQFPAVAMVNHSCMPNCALRMEGRMMCVYALRDLKAGSQVSVSYNNLRVKASERRLKMKNTWGFECVCERCVGKKDAYIAAYDSKYVCSCGGVRVPEVVSDNDEDDEESTQEENAVKAAPKARNAFSALMDSDEDESDEES
eukprot:TRINITY_DN20654_c0_g1_i2.p1 TRINITY_DN20654_c0_g1~~TRINITY_DN20654_c0_g1_i2.p1  ORF type:complete len:435 (-),score=109.27 TRINITY_DN20654_c0_g1_i2:118-1422(-)